MRDTFDTPGDWWTGSDEVGSSTLADGGFRWVIHEDRRSVWDTRDLERPLEVVRVDATVLVEQGSGGGGPLCGGADPARRSLWAGVNGDGEWILGRILDSRVQVVDRGELPAQRRQDVPVGAPHPLLVTLECMIDPIGTGHGATLWIDGTQVVDVAGEEVGPFATVGLTATGDREGFSILFDDFAAYDRPGDVEGSPSPST
jgi:hypothetical protein